jgi:hypothetical protein
MKLYTSQEYKNRMIGVEADESKIIKSDLQARVFDNGAVYVNKKTRGFGVLDGGGNLVRSSLCRHDAKGRLIGRADMEKIPYVGATAVYLGIVPFHFGHLLIEHLDRAHYRGQNVKYVFADNGLDYNNTAPGYLPDTLEVIGIRRGDVIILDETTRFDRVIVPDSATDGMNFTSRTFGAMFDELFVKPEFSRGEKIYLSRAKMGARRTYGEEKIQEIFRKNGFDIVYPETLPVAEQAGIARNATTLAGLAGTALHLALFMKPGGTVIQINRNVCVRESHSAQLLVNKIRGLKSVFVDGSIEKTPTPHFTLCPQIVGMTEHLKRFFDDQGFEYSDEDAALDRDARDEYERALADYKASLSKPRPVSVKVAKLLVRIATLFMPRKRWRVSFRAWADKFMQ